MQPEDPKSLGDEEIKQRRLELLEESRIEPLTTFVRKLRDEKSAQIPTPDFKKEDIPYFDPLDGGVKASYLFLFEAPGPKAVKSGFVSRNNPDVTAANFLALNACAGLDKQLTASWNIVPWYLGSKGRIRAARSKDINLGLSHLWELLDCFENLKFIVLGGRKAQRATKAIELSDFKGEVVHMWHPSPQSLNRVPQRRKEICEKLRKIAESCPQF